MLIGYARVSTNDQDTAAQVAALEAAGSERIFREKASGGRWDRPQFLRLLNQLRSGDVVVVWKLDRLSRSLRDLLTIMEQLSPRVRGNPGVRLPGGSKRGSIPACAGEPARWGPSSCRRGVYPRVCGGTVSCSASS